jgi:hypothetical protein
MPTQPSRTTVEPLQLRHFNTERLQNAFEDIIGKYARDFSEVGDEIDLDTNQIITNNGHLQKMRNEQDTGRYINSFVNDMHRDSRRRIPQNNSQEVQDDEGWEDVDGEEADDMDLDQQSQSQSPPQSSYVNRNAPPTRQINHILPNPPSRPAYSPAPQFNPSNQYSNIAANRDMIRDFAQGIAGQITEFLYFFAGSMQNQAQHQPASPSVFADHMSMPPPPPPPRPEPATYYDQPTVPHSRPSHKRRRTADENQPTSRKSSVNRLAALRAEGIRTPASKDKHGHRGVTPGMPSLWSGEEDSDYAPRRRSIKRPTDPSLTTPNNKSTNASHRSAESRLRTEVVNLVDPLDATDQRVRFSETGIHPGDPSLRDQTHENEDTSAIIQDFDDDDAPQHFIPDSEDDEVDSPELPEFLTIEDIELLRMSKSKARKYHPRIAFTPDHDRLIMKLKLEGKTYTEIAALLPHSSNQVMYRWKQFLEKGNMSAGFGRKTQEERERLALMSVIKFARQKQRGVSEEYDPSEDEAGLDMNLSNQKPDHPFGQSPLLAPGNNTLTPEPPQVIDDNDENDLNIDPALRYPPPTPAIKDEEVDDLDIDPELLSKTFKLTPKKTPSGKNTPSRREKANISRAMVNNGAENDQSSLLSLLEAAPTAQWSTGKKTNKTSRSAKNTPSRVTANADDSSDTTPSASVSKPKGKGKENERIATASNFVTDMNFNIITGPITEKKKRFNKKGKAAFKVRPQGVRADTELEEPDPMRRESWAMEDFGNDQG